MPEEITAKDTNADTPPNYTTEAELHTLGVMPSSPHRDAVEDSTVENITTPPPSTSNPAEANNLSPHIENLQAPSSIPAFIPELQPNEINFPQLIPHPQSPEPKTPSHSAPQREGETTPSQKPESPPRKEAETVPTFIWRRKDKAEDSQTTKGKEKVRGPESAPLTRQGYRSGRLAEDFWTAIQVPETPHATRKKLRVYPFLTKNASHTEYLVEHNAHKTITPVHIAELPAGVPWTTSRARQHIVNEVAQALHKILIFNNQQTSPFQTWLQGNWFSQWTLSTTGEQICTLFVSVEVLESKLKLRKGKKLGWLEIPAEIQTILNLPHTEEIQEAGEQGLSLMEMTGHKDEASAAIKLFTTATHNPFSILSEETTPATQNPIHER